MPPRRGKTRHQHGHDRPKARPDAPAPSTDETAPPSAITQTLRTTLEERTDQGALAALDALHALAEQAEALPPEQLAQAVLDTLAAHLDAEALTVLLEPLLHEPLDPAIHEQIIRHLESSRDPVALQALVTVGEHGQTRALRRAARGAIFRLGQAGVTLPAPPSAHTSRQDATSWLVERAWANRVDCIGSQAVGLARGRPQGDVGFISLVVSDDRGLVDGMGELGVSLRSVDRLAERLAIPPGAPLYEVGPEYVRYRLRQGLATGERAGRAPAPEYQRWSFLLDGIDDTWEPDLEGLCRERAQPSRLEQTSVPLYAVEYTDWWPDPEARDGAPVRRFIADVEAALARLPDEGFADEPALPAPSDLELLSETQFVVAFWPYGDAGSAIIERQIDQHIDAVLPSPRIRRLRDALLQMGYLADLSGRPTLCMLVMTAAWALDPESGVAPRRHPLLRQMLRKAVDVCIAD